VPDPASLIAVARMLGGGTGTPEIVDAQRRRAVSTAYYAVFHALMQRAAARFMGAGREAAAGYRMIYRSFEHGRVLQVCRDLSAETLSPAMQRELSRVSISRDMHVFARSFPELQRLRHDADYAPSIELDRTITLNTINLAEAAIAAFDAADPAEQADILALMMTRRRA
jgi:hypothetical protein